MRQRIVAVLTFVLTATLTLATPPIFHEGGYESARAEAEKSGKLLLVDFTAVWCGPCKRMDKDTWTNAGVEAWLREHTVSVQVDVDEQKEIAKKYRVRAMPTVVVVKNGEEFDRKTGYQSPDQLLGWVRDVRKGRTSRGIVIDKLESGDLSGAELVDAKMDFARMELDAGRYDSATEQYVWLWENMLEHNPSMVGVRSSFMLSDIQRLAEAHPPTKERIEEIRTSAFEEAMSRKSLTSLRDWATLSIEFGHDDEVLAWYDEHKDNPKYARAIQAIDFRLSTLLIEKKRWADYGRTLSEHPAELVSIQLSMLDRDFGSEMSQDQKHKFRSMMLGNILEDSSQKHVGLLAAGREVDAIRVAGTLFEALDEEELNKAKITLATDAYASGYPHKKHAEWAHEAGDDVLKSWVLNALAERD